MGKCDEANVEVSMGDSASPMKPDNFSFTVPPEAPVFEPTPEEFLDPLAYISKIRPIAEKSGICKIKPPESWQPPFAVDVDRLRFTPRIQRLNELEAITRVKLNFLDQIMKFWELQGSVLKIPTVERKPLDLYALHRIVKEAGGFEVCTNERKWSNIARRMGHPQGKGVGSILKNHYERILYPHDVFKRNGAVDSKDTKVEVKLERTPEKVTRGARSRPPATPPAPLAPSSPSSPAPRRARPAPDAAAAAEGSHTEGALPAAAAPLAPLAPAAPPPPAAPLTPLKEEGLETRRSPRENKWAGGGGTRSRRLREHRMSNMTVSVVPAPAPSLHDPLAKYMCRVCGRGDVEEHMLLCDGCDDSYHTFCLLPPLHDVPKGDWRCPVCLAEAVAAPAEAFGFEQASREYTLQQFGEMADRFKSDYFNMPVHMVPTSAVEREFWRVVSSLDEDVTVEYGADLHSMDHGSGFPTKSSAHLYPGEQEYALSSWNLNNLPVLPGSVLGHIHADISGMKIPWLYVGMCFATFCWHNEDHWSYSINYLHWGEPKTWYGVPGSKAEQFEAAMKAEAPELFQLQPDLLHQLVTIMNPNILMKAGVPVYRTDQHAGEFVITFPRAYHAGFNQGYNFAEAVNFTPADWLKMGRECIAHYSTLRRYCVFSHDELVCQMALQADSLSLGVALAAGRDLRAMLHDERRLRKALLDWGVTQAERETLELLPDDERQCHLCRTTCFLSCVTCACTAQRACLRHHAELCRCPPAAHTLRYRYTLDELPQMLDKLKAKSDAFREWAEAVQNALDPDTPKSCDLDGLRAHLRKAHELKMHKSELVRALETAIEDAEKCLSVIQQLDLNKMRTRTRQRDHHDPKYRLTLHELTLFAREIDGLACVLPEGSAVKEVLRQTAEFERRATELLAGEPGDADADADADVRELEEVVESGSRLCIRLPALPPLRARLQQARWLERARRARDDAATLTPAALRRLREEGERVPPHAAVEAELARLAGLRADTEAWEERAAELLAGAPTTTLAAVRALLEAGRAVPAALPSAHALQTAAAHAAEWLTRVEDMQARDLYPYCHTLETLVRRGRAIPLALVEKEHLATALRSALEWKQGTADIFLKKSWPHSLMEALSPRTESGTAGAGGAAGTGAAGKRRGKGAGAAGGSGGAGGATGGATEPPPSSLEAGLFLRNFSEDSTPTEIVAAFKQAEARELANMKELRARNLRKDPRAPPQPHVTFCLCQKRQYGIMTQCELCKDWFHAACIAGRRGSRSSSVEEGSGREDGVGGGAVGGAAGTDKFLCSGCRRSKRPRLERILALLVWLQKLPVRLPEGEALQCLTERAMAWQDVARAALLHHGPHLLDARDRHLHAELKKATGRCAATSEHAYSASPRGGGGGGGGGGAAAAGAAVAALEELMLEGDLLEVTLEEQAALWAAVAAARAGRGRVCADAGRLKRRQRQPRPHLQHKRTRPLAPHAPHSHHAHHAPLAHHKRTNPTTTNYLNRKQGGSSLMMRKHYLARQERRKRPARAPAPATRAVHHRARAGGSRGGRGGAGGSAGARGAGRDASTATSSSSDDDEDCAADTCLRPTGKEVDWVQCDGGCDGWFHMHCVGLARHALREDDDYVCTACRQAATPTPGTPATPAAHRQ